MPEPETPPCIRCGLENRMAYLGKVTTDFGGSVEVWVCQRDGIAAIIVEGKRPPDRHDLAHTHQQPEMFSLARYTRLAH